MDSNTVLRVGAVGLLGLMLFGAAFALHRVRRPGTHPQLPRRPAGRSARRGTYALPKTRSGTRVIASPDSGYCS